MSSFKSVLPRLFRSIHVHSSQQRHPGTSVPHAGSIQVPPRRCLPRKRTKCIIIHLIFFFESVHNNSLAGPGGLG